MLPQQHPIAVLLDKKLEEEQEDGRRYHLGASLIGKKCLRELWYSYRWAKGISKHSGRLLRLFNRGHLEEFRFNEFLRMIGFVVSDWDPSISKKLVYDYTQDAFYVAEPEHVVPVGCQDVTGYPFFEGYFQLSGAELPKKEQYKVTGVDGHFGGSLDGIATNVPPVIPDGPQTPQIGPDEEVLLEYKTHGTNSYKKLITEGVRISKPEHYAQMQTYMMKRGLHWALYCAVHKNDDDIWFEWIEFNQNFADEIEPKAIVTIHTKTPPDRISDSPSWFGCKFCDHRAHCHFGKDMAMSCRTCVHSTPVKNGEWHCSMWNKIIPKEAQKDGCPRWTMIRD